MKLVKWLSAAFIGVIAGFALLLAFWPSIYWHTPAGPERPASDGSPHGDPARGETVLVASGCASCHTADEENAPPLAGGRRLETPYGTFVVPNITPDDETGIGGWSDADFIRAMTLGLSPGGRHYYPAFPYTSYSRMTLRDILDLKAYLDAVAPVKNETAAHELAFPYGLRPGIGIWKALFFRPGRYEPDPGQSAEWNRGAYLALGLAHCSECHTPRNFAGAMRAGALMAGTEVGPEGDPVPNITPHEDGIASWSVDEITDFLEIGITPEGDFAGSAMATVIRHTTSRLPAEDRRAIAVYVKSLPPVPTGGD